MNPTHALPDISWDSDPRLILGWRQGRIIHGARVPLDRDVLDDIRAVGRAAFESLSERQARPYEPHAMLEEREEYFYVPVGALPTTHDPQDPDSPSAASILEVTGNPDGLEKMTPTDLGDYRFLFYGLVFSTTNDETVTLIKKEDPTRSSASVKVSLLGGSRLRRAETPLLALKEDVDLIIAQGDVMVLRKTAFEHLFNDVRVALQDVPRNVAATTSRLSKKVPLTKDAAAALTHAASQRVSYAVRLRALPGRLDQISATPQLIRDQLSAMGNAPNDLLDGDAFSFDASNVGLFLDLLEGRHFPDEWTGERMRADRMSRHQPGKP